MNRTLKSYLVNIAIAVITGVIMFPLIFGDPLTWSMMVKFILFGLVNGVIWSFAPHDDKYEKRKK